MPPPSKNPELEAFIRLELKIDELTKEINEQNKNISEIDKMLRGGNGLSNTGLISKVNMIENWISTRTWYERIIISAIAAELIGLIFLLITR